MASEVGVAYVTLLPSMSKFSQAVSEAMRGNDAFKGLTTSGGDSGTKAGKAAGSNFISAFKSSMGGSNIFNSFADMGAKAGKMLVSGIKTSYSTVGSVFKSVGSSQITNAGHALGINLGDGITSGLSTAQIAIGNAIGSVVTGAINTVAGSLGNAVQRLDTIKNFPKIMANIGIGEDASAQAIQTLSESIDGLPTSLDSLVSFAQKIIPAFNRDMDKATQSAIAFNHAIVAGGKDVVLQSNALEQWSQMLAAGKVDMAAWRSVVNAAPAQLQQVAESMGYATSMELYEDMIGSKYGERPLSDLNDAFLKLENEGLGDYASFAEQAKVATEGIGTAVTNVQNRISKALATVLDWIGQANISNAINTMTRSFGPAAQAFVDTLDSYGAKQWFVDLGKVASESLNGFGDAAQPIKDVLRPFVESVMPEALNVAKSALDSIVAAAGPFFGRIAALISDITTKVPELSSQIQDIVSSWVSVKFDTMASAAEMWSKVIQALLPVLPQIIEANGMVIQAVASVVGGLAPVLAPLAADLYSSVAGVIAQGAPFVERIVTMLAPHVSTLIENFERVAGAVFPAMERIFQAIDPIIDPVLNLLGQVGEILAPVIAQVVEDLAPVLPGILTAASGVLNTLAPILPTIIEAFIAAKGIGLGLQGFDILKSIFGAITSDEVQYAVTQCIVPGVQGAFAAASKGMLATAVSSATIGLPAAIDTAATGLAGAFAAVASLPTGVIVGALASIVGSLVWCWQNSEDFRDKICGAFDSVGKAAGELFDTIGPAIEVLWSIAKPIFELFAKLVGTTFATAFKTAADVVVAAINTIKGVIEIVEGVFKTFFGLIKGLFTGDWSDMFDGAGLVVMGFKDTIEGVFNGIYSIVMDIFGGIFDFFEDAFGTIGDILSGIGDFVSGGLDIKVSSDVPSEKPFALGGIVTRPTRAILGEAGVPEAAVPLTAQSVEQFVSGLGVNVSNGGNTSIVINIDKIVNQDTATDVPQLVDLIGREVEFDLRSRGVIT